LQCLFSVPIIVRGVLLVQVSRSAILSCVQRSGPFKIIGCSSCLEWRYTYPLLEEAGLEAWAVDILGWGFSNLGMPPLPRVIEIGSVIATVESCDHF
jgi:hypothetical protein